MLLTDCSTEQQKDCNVRAKTYDDIKCAMYVPGNGCTGIPRTTEGDKMTKKFIISFDTHGNPVEVDVEVKPEPIDAITLGEYSREMSRRANQAILQEASGQYNQLADPVIRQYQLMQAEALKNWLQCRQQPQPNPLGNILGILGL